MMLFEMTQDILKLCNKVFPHLETAQLSPEERLQLYTSFKALVDLNQDNLDVLYPERHKHQTDIQN